MTLAQKWDLLFQYFGIKDFITFISSPAIQEQLVPVKIVFILFTGFFLCAIVWFYLNSSYLSNQFLQDTTEFLSWQAYGMREINKRWAKLVKKAQVGNEDDVKLAVIEADDFLYQVMEEAGLEGDNFEQFLENARKKVTLNVNSIMEAHAIRNSIVYNPDYRLEAEKGRKLLSDYENAIKTVAAS